MVLVFATNNAHKLSEMQVAIGNAFTLKSLAEAGITIDIAEPHDSLEANAEEKSSTIYKLLGGDCFSEDTGLEVDALDGEPGVRSARYAGENKSPADNTRKLLEKLSGMDNRNAKFRTVISLILGGRKYQFEGICPGRIAAGPSGKLGFGYDPVFIPEGAERTFAEMTIEEKGKYSHRRKAADKLITFLQRHGYAHE